MLQRPDACRGCQLDRVATGFSHPTGPIDAPIAFWGEALGADEAGAGEPFVGAAGRHLNRLIKRLGRPRELHRVHNIISCRPPRDWLVGAPWYHSAISNCQPNRAVVLNERKRVHVALGGTAGKILLNYPPKFNVRSFHGCPFETPFGTVITTFHPSSLFARGDAVSGPQFTNVFLFDMKRAFEIAEKGWTVGPFDAIEDPPPDWVQAWFDQVPEGTWVFPDIETPGKVERDQKAEDKEDADEDLSIDDALRAERIVRIGFSVHPDEGFSIPWVEPYISLVKQFFARRGLVFWFWNWRFDVKILEANGVVFGSEISECMDAWGAVQTRLPRKVAFVAPFFSDIGPWKHLASTNLARYNALDCIQQCRSTHGIAQALQREGRWEAFYRHRHLIDVRALVPAEKVGLHVDRTACEELGRTLDGELGRLSGEMAKLTEIGRVTMKRRKPQNPEGYQLEMVDVETTRCARCGMLDVAKKHRCQPIVCTQEHDGKFCPVINKRAKVGHKVRPQPEVILGTFHVERWVKREPFNPDARLQMLRYIESIGERPGKNKKTNNPSVGKGIVAEIAKRRDDPLLLTALRSKEISKVKSTYVDGVLKRLTAASRVHGEFTHAPWTWRLSMRNPNLQNVKTREKDEDKPEAAFKRVVIAGEDCLLVEADYSSIEAVKSGYFMGDPDYARLAMLGMHAFVVSHKIGRPADRRWSDEHLAGYLAEIKADKANSKTYEAYKRGVHARNYVGSAYAIHKAEPAMFPKLRDAEEFVQLYDSLTPKRVQWWQATWDLARRQNYLENPYKYRAYFWDIDKWNPRSRIWEAGAGSDGKKAVSFVPQSSAYGTLADATLELFDPESPFYVGDFYFGRTPLRALVHDSLLAEVEETRVDAYCRRLHSVMTRELPLFPLPWDLTKNLHVGVAIKVGPNWRDMTEWKEAT